MATILCEVFKRAARHTKVHPVMGWLPISGRSSYLTTGTGSDLSCIERTTSTHARTHTPDESEPLWDFSFFTVCQR